MPADTFMVPGFSVKVAGSPLPKSVADAVMTVEVQQSLELIDMFTIVLDNDHGQIGDSDLFKEGNEVEIELGYSGEPEKLMKGEIISLEPTWPEDTSPTLLVRGYDRVHRLSRGRKTRSFLQVKVSDVVQQLAGEEGISAEVDDTELVHEYLFQNNQTNIELIYQLARRHFFEVDLDLSGTLNFKKPSSNKPKSCTLKWGHDLKSFYVRESVTEVPTSVTTMGWDPKQKQAITHKTTDLHASLGSKLSPKVVESAFGDNPVQLSLRPTVAPSEAEALAVAAFNQRVQDSVRGHGTCMGEAKIKPGIVLEIQGLGTLWSGGYYVVAATHLLHPATGYVTEFHVRRTGTQ